LAALYRGGGPPVLFAHGAPDGIAGLLDEIAGEPEALLQVRSEVLPVIASRYEVLKAKPMGRMALDPQRRRAPAAAEAAIERLEPRDLAALERL
jgi:hypothetical protein